MIYCVTTSTGYFLVRHNGKVSVTGNTSYGMGAKLLHENYPDLFPATMRMDPKTGRMKRCDTCTAQDEIDEFYSLVPDLKAWHKSTRDFAHKHGYLQSNWGVRNYYYSVYKFDWATKEWKLGDDAKACIAFQPQHANAMCQRRWLKQIHATIKKMGKQDKWKLTAIGHVHDSNGLRVPEDDQEKAAQMMAEIMNQPIPEMNNIQVGVQVKAGKSWSDMEPILTV